MTNFVIALFFIINKLTALGSSSSRSEYSFVCCACLQCFYLPSFCLPDSFNFIFSNFLQAATVGCA